MVASRQVEIPYYRAVGRQRGRGFGALAQFNGRTAIPFLRNYVVPAAKRVGADLLEFSAPEIGEVLSSRKPSRSAAKSVGKQILKKTIGSREQERDCKQSHSDKIYKTNQSVAKRPFYKHFSLIMSNNNFRY